MEVIAKAGRYELLEELGHGAMGVVYKANDPVIGRRVAVKTIRLAAGGTSMPREELLARFRTEARAAGSLTHPNIVVVYDAGEQDGLFYIIMEYVEGRSLQSVLDAGQPIPLARAVQIVEQVCSALDYAHQHRIVHRDIKPANLLLASDDAVKVTDFGTAKILALGTLEQSQIIGTPSYMSPEQVKGKPVDGRSDIFSLGVVLYELATGQKPFPGENITTVIYKIVNEEPIPPRQLDPSLHPGLSNVILRALAKDPAARFQSCHEFAEALKNYRSYAGGAGTTLVMDPRPASPATTVISHVRPSAPPPPAPKRSWLGNALFTLLLLGVIYYAGGKVWPVIHDTWEQLRETRSASVTPPALPPNLAPPKPDFEAILATRPHLAVRPQQPAAKAPQPTAEPPAPKEVPKAEVPPKVEEPPKTDPRLEGLKKLMDDGLARAGLAEQVHVSAAGETLTFTGRLSPLQHRQLARRLQELPTWVRVQDDIEYAPEVDPPGLAADLNGKGLAVINSQPAGAEVIVDGRPTGLVTPARIRLAPGEHTVAVSLAGHAPVRRVLNVVQNRIARVNVNIF